MKALSVRAPWWWLILHCGKDIENRDWRCGYRGRVFIHASKWYVHGDVVEDLCTAGRMVPGVQGQILMAGHPQRFIQPHCGAVVGSVEVVDCVQSSTSPWFEGKFGFVLRDPIIYAKPFPMKGSLGFFETGMTEAQLIEVA